MSDLDDLSAGPSQTSLFRSAGVLAYAGLIFIAFAPVMFSIAAWRLLTNPAHHNYKVGAETVGDYTGELVLCGIAAFSALLGVSLLRAGGLSNVQPNRVINRAEWETICEQVKDGNEEPITQYIRLTSLTGFTGTFTKLGLNGLPLATIALTLFFSLLFLQNAAYMDLAKLTLGAFIGSFVQKQVGAQGSGSVKLPGGEKVSFSSEAPYA